MNDVPLIFSRIKSETLSFNFVILIIFVSDFINLVFPKASVNYFRLLLTKTTSFWFFILFFGN